VSLNQDSTPKTKPLTPFSRTSTQQRINPNAPVFIDHKKSTKAHPTEEAVIDSSVEAKPIEEKIEHHASATPPPPPKVEFFTPPRPSPPSYKPVSTPEPQSYSYKSPKTKDTFTEPLFIEFDNQGNAKQKESETHSNSKLTTTCIQIGKQ
jgi:hypothetical protein